MKIIFIDSSVKEPKVFKKILNTEIETYIVTTDFDKYSPEEIDIAIIWLQVPPIISSFSNLELILVCGSGIDHIIDNNYLPKDVPLIRLVDHDLRKRVANYVLNHVLEYQNRLIISDDVFLSGSDQLKEESARKSTLRIGIMGLGLIGSTIAHTLESRGIEVFGWARTNKKRMVRSVFIGPSSLSIFAKQCDVIVCQLPLTPATKGILNRELFEAMPKGGYIINVGRGAHLDDEDLIGAIETGQLSGASLDVFTIEPLPQNHPFHKISEIRITPHIAGIIDPEKQAGYAHNVIQNFYSRKKLEGIVMHEERY